PIRPDLERTRHPAKQQQMPDRYALLRNHARAALRGWRRSKETEGTGEWRTIQGKRDAEVWIPRRSCVKSTCIHAYFSRCHRGHALACRADPDQLACHLDDRATSALFAARPRRAVRSRRAARPLAPFALRW